jgi:hypothetical protein
LGGQSGIAQGGVIDVSLSGHTKGLRVAEISGIEKFGSGLFLDTYSIREELKEDSAMWGTRAYGNETVTFLATGEANRF